MTIVITRESADASLDKLIAQFGEDYIYQKPGDSCANIVRNQDGEWEGSCLIGRVYLDHGITPQDLVNADCVHTSVYSVSAAPALIERLIFNSPQTVDYLSYIQSLQDRGIPWGEALRMARTNSKAIQL